MANLETAGGQALDKLKELLPQFDQADKAFNDAEQQIKKAQQALETDWNKVEQASTAFLEQVKKERTDFSSETQDTMQSIQELKAKVTDITEKAKDAASDAKDELEEFAQDVQKLEPEIEKLMKKVDDAAKSLKDKADAIEEKLEDVSNQVSDFLENEIVNDFKNLQQEVEDRAQALKDYVTDTCVPNLEDKGEEMANKLSDFAQQMQQKMEETGNNAMQQASDALEKCFSEHKEVIDSIMNLGQSLQKLLDGLCDAVDAVGKTVGETKEVVETGVDTTSVGLTAVIDTVNELMEFFSRFSFV